MNIRINETIAGVGLALAISVVAPSAQAQVNLLADPGFELRLPGPLPLGTVLGNPSLAANQGFWGAEMGTIASGSQLPGPIIPFGGTQMLCMTNAGGVTTQTFQNVDVTSFSSLIDSGAATFTLGGLFNANVAAAGNVILQFYGIGGEISPFATGPGFVLDNNPTTWQPTSITGLIPPATRSVRAQVFYSNASLTGQAGYVDNVGLTIVPEPGTALFGLATLGACFKRSRRRS